MQHYRTGLAKHYNNMRIEPNYYYPLNHEQIECPVLQHNVTQKSTHDATGPVARGPVHTESLKTVSVGV